NDKSDDLGDRLARQRSWDLRSAAKDALCAILSCLCCRTEKVEVLLVASKRGHWLDCRHLHSINLRCPCVARHACIRILVVSAMAESPPKSVRINIGGEKVIQVHTELFRVAGDNKLSALFSGRWEPHLDPSGYFFVDYSPEVFMPFVEWLRELRDTPPGQTPPCIEVDGRHRRAIIRMMAALTIEVRYLRRAGFSVEELLSLGFEVGCCFAGGCTAKELLQAGASIQSLRKAGVPASDLKDAVAIKELRLAGYTATDCLQAGETVEDLLGMKLFTLAELRGAGVTVKQLIDAGCDLPTLKKQGFGVVDVLQAGATVEVLLATKSYTLAELHEAGMTVKQLIDAGCDLPTLKQAGFTVGDVLQAGTTVEVLLATKSYTLAELREAGVTVRQLIDAGCDLPTLKRGGVGIGDVLQAGATVEVLLATNTCTLAELHGAGVEPGTKRIFFDAGGTKVGDRLLWFAIAYDKRALPLDEIYVWEVKNISDAQCRQNVPQQLYDRFHPVLTRYNAVGISEAVGDRNNPVTLVCQKCRPQCFCVFKLDVDTPGWKMQLPDSLSMILAI
ncbi:unnamed protein product, partial [Symbiodinium microadriaticum]